MFILTPWRKTMDQKIDSWRVYIDDEAKEFALSSAVLGAKRWWEPVIRAIADDGFREEFCEGPFECDMPGGLKVFPLSRLLSEHSEDDMQRYLDTFRARSATSFSVKLRRDAIRLEGAGRCCTYVVIGPSDNIVVYIMLGLGGVIVPEGNRLSKRVLDRLGLDDGHAVVPSFVLAQLSWSLDCPDYMEDTLLVLAYNLIMRVRKVIGGNLVLIE